MLRHVVLTSCCLLAPAALADTVDEAVIFAEDFNALEGDWAGGPKEFPEFTKYGGIEPIFVDPANSTTSGTPALFLDAHGAIWPTTTAIVLETGAELTPGTDYRLLFDLAKRGTSADFVGEAVVRVYAGQPLVKPAGGGERRPLVESGTATLLAKVRIGGSDEGLNQELTFRTNRRVTNQALFLVFECGTPRNTDRYGQVEIDNIEVLATLAPTDEPG